MNFNLVCPNCNSEDLLNIVYGYPSKETMNRASAGEFALGGCVVSSSSPQYICEECDTKSITVNEINAFTQIKTEIVDQEIEDIQSYLFDIAIDSSQPLAKKVIAIRYIRSEKKLKEIRLGGDSTIQQAVKERYKLLQQVRS